MTNSERTSGYKLKNGKIEPIFENDNIDNNYKKKISGINIAVCKKYASFYKKSKIEQHELCCYAAQAIFNYFFHIPRKEYLDALVGFNESDNGNKTKLLYKTSLIRLVIKRSKSGWFYGNLIYNCRFLHTLFTTILAYIWEMKSGKRIRPY